MLFATLLDNDWKTSTYSFVLVFCLIELELGTSSTITKEATALCERDKATLAYHMPITRDSLEFTRETHD